MSDTTRTICDVCVIEDDPETRRQIVNELSRDGYDCLTAPDGATGWQFITKHHPKVVLSDLMLPVMDGIHICEQMRSTPELATTFFVVLTGCDDHEKREETLRSGADDYLIKPFDPMILKARVRMGIRMWEVRERLRQAAIKDGLTGLYNHDYLTTVIEREMNRARRYGGQLSLIMLDLDYFKAINDTFGHLVGNATLVEVARVLRENVREFDTVGRFGGEEFAVVAPEASLDDAVAISERIRLATADTLHVEALREHRVTASLGVACADDSRVRTAADLIDLADRALYSAKHHGRNCVITAHQVKDEDQLNSGLQGKEIETLRKRVAVLSVQAKDVYMQTVSSLLQALEEKDPFTARHSLNVACYCEMLARAMALSEPLTATIRNAGQLHDIGKVGIPDRILIKPEALTEIEKSIMQHVPAISVRILDHLRILESEMHIIRHQREFFDGTGYPSRLRGEQIPIGSRIVLLANAFDAMTTDRVYRPCCSIDDAMHEIQSQANRQFDPRVVAAMEAVLRSQRGSVESRIAQTGEIVHLPATAVY